MPPGSSLTKVPLEAHLSSPKKGFRKNERSAAMFGYFFRQLEIEISASELLERRTFILVFYEYSYNVIPKIIPKPTPSLVLYTDRVGLTESHTERHLSSSHPNRCLYSVLAFMGYAWSPMLCATTACSTSTDTCSFFRFLFNFLLVPACGCSSDCRSPHCYTRTHSSKPLPQGHFALCRVYL